LRREARKARNELDADGKEKCGKESDANAAPARSLELPQCLKMRAHVVLKARSAGPTVKARWHSDEAEHITKGERGADRDAEDTTRHLQQHRVLRKARVERAVRAAGAIEQRHSRRVRTERAEVLGDSTRRREVQRVGRKG
jgi:hypothetical protein